MRGMLFQEASCTQYDVQREVQHGVYAQLPEVVSIMMNRSASFTKFRDPFKRVAITTMLIMAFACTIVAPLGLASERKHHQHTLIQQVFLWCLDSHLFVSEGRGLCTKTHDHEHHFIVDEKRSVFPTRSWASRVVLDVACDACIKGPKKIIWTKMFDVSRVTRADLYLGACHR